MKEVTCAGCEKKYPRKEAKRYLRPLGDKHKIYFGRSIEGTNSSKAFICKECSKKIQEKLKKFREERRRIREMEGA